MSDFELDPADRDQLLKPPDPEWDPLGPERRAFKQFAALTREKREYDRLAKQAKDKLDVLAAQIRTYLEGSDAYEGVIIDGYRIYLKRQLWAKRHDWVSTADMCAALKECDLGHMVREEYSATTLSNHIHELEEQHADEIVAGTVENVRDLLPPALAALVDVEPSYSVVALTKK